MIAIGNPFGYSRTVTTGIVSGLQREIQAPERLHDPGRDPDRRLDQPRQLRWSRCWTPNGRVIGINSQIATGGGQGSVGIGFSVPINTAKRLLPDLKAGEAIEHALPRRADAGRDQAACGGPQPGLDKGALVVEVTKGSPADKAGLRGGRTQTAQGIAAGGDLIVAVDGKPVSDSSEVADAISQKQPGDDGRDHLLPR